MKKFRIVLLSVILGLLLCACGEEEELSAAQAQRNDNAGTIATSYAIDVISTVAQRPDFLFQTPYTDYTYDELETIMREYIGFSVDGYAFVTAVDSFQKGLAETGAILSTGAPVVTVDGNEIIVDVECVCETRYADVEMIFTNDLIDPVMTSAAFNVRYTMKEKMGKAGINTAIGMFVVFAMLIIIAVIIWLFGLIPTLFKGQNKKDKTAESIDKAVEQIVKNETTESSDAELVAVIAAAVAAYEGTTDTSGFVVRSIRKIKRQ